ncbi:MAG: formylglycine-generating enzyme family protein [Bacteroidales bacterium]|jgi:formylglycine-generating enzyme required for sulfatase activity|nr:formylglycine-generating enzyme family protein [Bacteroidales bacterium]
MKNILLLFLLIFSNFVFSQTKPNISWVRVEGGTFLMGCSQSEEECYPDEEPKHKVTISTFEISPFEVTVKEYRMFCLATNRKMPKEPSWGFVDNYPMVYISWQDAKDYASWIGGRLPTEAEWEFAAKGGVLSNNYSYSGSNNWDEVGWSFENSNGRVHPVGEKKPNELGLYDMSGNAWEWVNDYYEIYYYKESPKKNPKGPKSGEIKCNRGGCFNFDYKLMRPSHRRGSSIEVVGFGTGFRVARDISPPKDRQAAFSRPTEVR